MSTYAPFAKPLYVMLKPVGAVCNLACDYCYYLEKEALYPGKHPTLPSFKMPDNVLEKLIREYILSQPQEQIEFVWHGGEPTLLGVEYFRKILDIQKKQADGKKILNAFQTNGTLINEEWANFLAENHFLCGLSIDGPKKYHDNHRRYPNGKGSWDKAMECVKLFQKYGVEFNTMSVVNASNSKQPALVYDFLKSIGSQQRRGYLTGDYDHWRTIHQRVSDTRDGIRSARAGSNQRHSYLAGYTGISLSRMGSALLVAHQYMPQLVPIII